MEENEILLEQLNKKEEEINKLHKIITYIITGAFIAIFAFYLWGTNSKQEHEVSDNKYNELKYQYEELKYEYNKLLDDYDALKADYDALESGKYNPNDNYDTPTFTDGASEN